MEENVNIHWAQDPDLLEEFVLIRMDAVQIERYRLHLKECSKCRELVEHEQIIAVGIKRHGRDQLRARLQQHLASEDRNPSGRQLFISLAAALVILAIGLSVIIYLAGPSGNDARLRTREVALGRSGQKGIWIHGVVISRKAPAAGRHAPSSAPQLKIFVIKDHDVRRTIVLRQLPAEESQKNAQSTGSNVKTLLEKNENGIVISMYQFPEEAQELMHATIEPVSADSLLVRCDGLTIAYHIPGGWRE